MHNYSEHNTHECRETVENSVGEREIEGDKRHSQIYTDEIDAGFGYGYGYDYGSSRALAPSIDKADADYYSTRSRIHTAFRFVGLSGSPLFSLGLFDFCLSGIAESTNDLNHCTIQFGYTTTQTHTYVNF